MGYKFTKSPKLRAEHRRIVVAPVLSFVMSLIRIPLFLLQLCFGTPTVVPSQDFYSANQCRNLEFRSEKAFEGKRLMKHTIRVVEVMVASFCENLCYMEPDCVSINLDNRVDGLGVYKCELNNATHEGPLDELTDHESYFYHAAESNCVQSPCKNNATCQSGFTEKGYRCLCPAGFEGSTCHLDINECVQGLHKCSPRAFCSNTKGSYNCTCKPGFTGKGQECKDIDECINGFHKCSLNAFCKNTKGSYNCTCEPGFSGNGQECNDIDECVKGLHTCNPNAFCNNTDGSYNCACKPGFTGNGRECKGTGSCKEIYDKKVTNMSGVVTLLVDSQPVSVLCHMGDFGCGDGGWTPILKIDGTKTTFLYDQPYWSDYTEYNLLGGETGFDEQETKLPTYWNTSFSKICLGMKKGKELNFIVIAQQAISLFSLIADGQHRHTTLGRDTWKKLIGSEASLQLKCNGEGFNSVCKNEHSSKARIGIVNNDYDPCLYCDSRIGFGTGGHPDLSNACGNVANHSPDNGDKFINTMGYILVQ